uniref:Uncharacterized protein n=1 Tax=Rhizophora mucronata TaxID=61149 RepID=A0A2P2Q0T4_RHIMU
MPDKHRPIKRHVRVYCNDSKGSIVKPLSNFCACVWRCPWDKEKEV